MRLLPRFLLRLIPPFTFLLLHRTDARNPLYPHGQYGKFLVLVYGLLVFPFFSLTSGRPGASPHPLPPPVAGSQGFLLLVAAPRLYWG